MSPAQLPAAVPDFTGRDAQVRDLTALTSTRDGHPVPATAVAITGTAGVGKTALAVHWSHQVRDRFPDGQLYVDLRGHSPVPPLRPVDALVRFLHALGVPAQQIPPEEGEAVGLYRSLLADRRILVVLDNAANSEQVRPLLPGGRECLALVTSRNRLSSLLAREGARRVALTVLTPAEAYTLLARILGPDHVAAEPEQTAELARMCAHLPLALRIAAARVANDPHGGLAAYLDDLRHSDDRLAAFEVDEDTQAAVRATFHLSYASLADPPRRLFRLLGLVPGPNVTAEAAAALIDAPVEEAARLLDQLAACHLVGHPAPGRFAGHDLLRLYARERAEAEDDEPRREAAVRRLFDHYLRTVDAAARRLYPDILRLPAQAEAMPSPVAFADHTEALAWLDAERPNLISAVQHAAEHGPRSAAWLLADAMRGYFWARMHTVDWLTVADAALRAADGEPQARAAAHLSLGDLHMRQGRYRRAISHYRKASALNRETGWLLGEVAALGNLGVVYWQTGQLRSAASQFTEAYETSLRTGRLEGQAAALVNLGMVFRELGQLEEAADQYTKALVLDRKIGSSMGEAIELANLAEANHAMGRLDLALDQLTRAWALHRDVGDRDTEAETLHRLAAVHRDSGRHTEALDLARAACELARETGSRRVETDAANALATVYHHLGRFTEAINLHEQALDLARGGGNRYPQAYALIGLAAAHHHAGRAEHAGEVAQEALSIARRAEYRMLEGQVLTRIAAIRLTQDSPLLAVESAREALQRHDECGHRLGSALAQLALSEALERGGDAGAAAAHRRRAERLFSDVGSPLTDQASALLPRRHTVDQ